MMRSTLIRCLPALTLVALTALAQDAPRLDGSNVQQPSAPGWTVVQPPDTPAPAQGQGKGPRKRGLARAATQPAPAPAAEPAAPVPAANVNIVTPAAAPTTPSPVDMPAEPAAISFQNGFITVHARNSSLTQILRDMAVKTGMSLEGSPEDERIFGDYGPAPVRQVLAQLLDGGSSNYLVFGTSDNHAPKSLVISPRTSLAPNVAQNTTPQKAASDDDDDDDDAPAQPIVPIRPRTNQIPPGQSSNVRTPQQILEEMQRRRQEQQDNSTQ